MRDAVLDLLLGSGCVLCGRPGRALCALCEWSLPSGCVPAWPTPCPDGLARPMAVGEYAGPLKVLVNAHKERRRLALARPLGRLLAGAVAGVVPDPRHAARDGRPLVLVPVPSRRSVVRRRGHDPMLRVARCAAVALRRQGRPATVSPLLRSAGPARDQAGLGATERMANLDGTMVLRRVRVPGGGPRPRYVVVDDVLTTGATAREAQRAMEAVGLVVAGIATVAATRRRFPGPLVQPHAEGSLPFSDRGD